jgi:hypothetical protein
MEFKEINFKIDILYSKINIKEELMSILNKIELTYNGSQLTNFYSRNLSFHLSNDIFLLLKQEFNYLCGKLNGISLNITDWWLQRYSKGHFHNLHTHGADNNRFSFIIYLDCSENSSEIQFYGPNYPLVHYEPIKIKPEKGLFVIFPSHLPHCVLPNNDDKRFILSGNFSLNIK